MTLMALPSPFMEAAERRCRGWFCREKFARLGRFTVGGVSDPRKSECGRSCGRRYTPSHSALPRTTSHVRTHQRHSSATHTSHTLHHHTHAGASTHAHSAIAPATDQQRWRKKWIVVWRWSWSSEPLHGAWKSWRRRRAKQPFFGPVAKSSQ